MEESNFDSRELKGINLLSERKDSIFVLSYFLKRMTRFVFLLFALLQSPLSVLLPFKPYYSIDFLLWVGYTDFQKETLQ